MNPKNHLQKVLENHSLSFQERMFRLISGIGILALVILLLVSIALHDNVNTVLMLFISAAVCLTISVITIRTGKIQAGANILSFLIIFGLIPVAFFFGGGIHGGAPLWFVFGFVFVSIVVYGRMKYVFLICASIMAVLIYSIAYLFPEWVDFATEEEAYVSSFISVGVVSSLFCLLFIFESRIYESENEIMEQQKKEIMELGEAQSRFYSSMSHEIRTPINTIIGLDEMILREEISEEVAKDAEDIRNASKMLLALINDVLDMSKIESGKMELVSVSYDVGEMLSDIVNMIWSAAKEKGLEFHVEVDPATPSQLIGDEVRIKQVMINLLTNAVKYTREGSVVFSIQCRKITDKRVLVTYSIRDTGMGIKKENIPYLFSAFKRMDEEKNRFIEGTGLGLSIVKQFIDLMGGTITVDSVYTKGSSFIVELEQDIGDENEIGELNLELRHTMNTREHYKQSFEAPEARVLIVDDNETNLMVETKLLRDTKIRIDTASSGADALEKTLQTHYDTILMDHLMPGMDGIACLLKIRTQAGGLNRESPVVVLTANAGSEQRMIYEREGFDGYLLKPVNGADLEAELLRHLPKELVKIMRDPMLTEEIQTAERKTGKYRQILITTDSVCDLPEYVLSQHQIDILPYHIKTMGGEFLDGVEMETDGILSYLSRQENAVSSDAPSVGEYEEFFAEHLTKTHHIIHITMARKVSEGYENALEAAKSFDNVNIVDSGLVSSGMGLLVISAAELAEENRSVEEIIEGIRKTAEKIRFSFMVSSTEWLARTGRISPFLDRFFRAFLMHPVIELKGSRIKSGRLRFGALGQAKDRYIRAAFADPKSIDNSVLIIIHAGVSAAELQDIEEKVRSVITFDRVIQNQVSSAIAINCGAGSFGFTYMLR